MGGVESPGRFNTAFELPLSASDTRLESKRVECRAGQTTYGRKSRVSLMDDATLIVKGEANLQSELISLHDDLRSVNGVMHVDKCLTASMKKGSFKNAHHRYTIRGKEVPNLADEGTDQIPRSSIWCERREGIHAANRDLEEAAAANRQRKHLRGVQIGDLQ